MPHRTHLTTPPGQNPVTEADGSQELYSTGFALPAEPGVPMRFRGLVIGVAVVLGLLLVAWIGFKLVTAGQDFDPSLDVEQPGEFDPTIPAIPGEG